MTNIKVSLVCPICSESFENDSCKKAVYPTNTNKDGIFNRPHSIYFCRNCGIGIASPTLADEQLAYFYSQGEYWKGSRKGMLLPRKIPGQYALAQARWDFVGPFVKENGKKNSVSILDIGAGHGFFGVVAARDRNICMEKYDVVEKDSMLREFLGMTWHKYFPKVRFEAKDSLEKVKGEYDIIVLSHILEHLNNPKDILSTAIKKLTKNGFVFVDVPNQDYLFKQDVFPHVLFFHKMSLNILLQECKLFIKTIVCCGRNRKDSPINYRNENAAVTRIIKALYKARRLIPAWISVPIFNWYYGGDKQDENGTWIRALAQKSNLD